MDYPLKTLAYPPSPIISNSSNIYLFAIFVPLIVFSRIFSAYINVSFLVNVFSSYEVKESNVGV